MVVFVESVGWRPLVSHSIRNSGPKVPAFRDCSRCCMLESGRLSFCCRAAQTTVCTYTLHRTMPLSIMGNQNTNIDIGIYHTPYTIHLTSYMSRNMLEHDLQLATQTSNGPASHVVSTRLMTATIHAGQKRSSAQIKEKPRNAPATHKQAAQKPGEISQTTRRVVRPKAMACAAAAAMNTVVIYCCRCAQSHSLFVTRRALQSPHARPTAPVADLPVAP